MRLPSPLPSRRELFALAGQYTYPLGNFVPQVLRHTDLPSLAAAMAPRRIVLAGAVDAAARTLPETEVRGEFAGASVEVRPDAMWTAEVILGI